MCSQVNFQLLASLHWVGVIVFSRNRQPQPIKDNILIIIYIYHPRLLKWVGVTVFSRNRPPQPNLNQACSCTSILPWVGVGVTCFSRKHTTYSIWASSLWDRQKSNPNPGPDLPDARFLEKQVTPTPSPSPLKWTFQVHSNELFKCSQLGWEGWGYLFLEMGRVGGIRCPSSTWQLKSWVEDAQRLSPLAEPSGLHSRGGSASDGARILEVLT